MNETDVFFRTTVAGREYQGVIALTGSLFICCKASGEGVPLYSASLQWTKAPPSHDRQEREGWWLVRGENEPVVFLSGFTADDSVRLGDEFGIPPAGERFDSPHVREEYFLSSSAWEGMRAWVEQDSQREGPASHPTARRKSWYIRAIAQIQVGRELEE